MNLKRTLALAGLSLVMASSAFAADKMKALVTVLPQADVVSRIAGDLWDVTVMIPQGADPHEYTPKPSQLKEATDAKVWFTVGMPLETSQLDKIKSVSKDLEVVAYGEKIAPRNFETIYEADEDGEVKIHSHNHDDHDHDGHVHGPECDHDHDGDDHDHDHEATEHDGHVHGPECDHDHEGEECHHHHHHHDGVDPHTWLSAKGALLAGETVRDTFIRLDPEHKATYEANYQAFAEYARSIDAKVEELLKDAKGKTFMTFHPAWGYFARDYGLVQLPIEVEGKEPGQKTLKNLIDFARKEEVRAILVEPQFSNKGAEVIAKELNIPTLTVDPLNPDWGDGMVKAAEAIAQGVK